jgi:endonuclease/exonuclease/phosphatase family metal-dependent hydrolase
MIKFFLGVLFSVSALASTPFNTLPFALSGAAPTNIPAVQYDVGTLNDAFFDASSGNRGGVYRTDDVDIESSSEGGYNIGWISAGDWLKYTINVQAGCYTVIARAASPYSTVNQIQFEAPGVDAVLTIPNTGGWQVWRDISKTNLCFSQSGVQPLYVRMLTNNFNFKSLQFVPQITPTSPFANVTLPGRIEAENFDNGGMNNAYYDVTTGNEGGAYRSGNVDIQACLEGGFNVGWMSPGEWLQYTVNVSSDGAYNFISRVATRYATSTFDLLVDDNVVGSNISFLNTGGWQTWTDVIVPAVNLTAGSHKIRFRVESNGLNLNYLQVNAVTPVSTGNLRVMSWNIQHGDKGTTAIANEMLASGADVFLLQEVWDTRAQDYANNLQTLTGVPWYTIYRLGNGHDGNAIVSRFPFVETETGRWTASNTSCYPNRSAVRAAIRINGVTIQFFDFHNDTCSDNRSYLIDRLLEFMAPTSNDPQLLAGDFNAVDSDSTIRKLIGTTGRFYDVWNFLTGETGSNTNNKTHNSRIDFQFVTRNEINVVRPMSIRLRNANYSLSDHRSVVADYVVAP